MKHVLFLRGIVVRAEVTALHPRLLVAKYLKDKVGEVGALEALNWLIPQTYACHCGVSSVYISFIFAKYFAYRQRYASNRFYSNEMLPN